ncbi:BZ3500_MvSof-1268-A1-R1_Chr10-1g02590 [Microbotryum saponariae]|uniref:BZ3500_MvSof-1268-A1-R1_Chr10-1g02590 protein n=1 Tax=Microbotryum saponariae TaxID=289078 RepID=A0A2X0LJN1_9BASI|nr:BZ3500_MvSof-1268-A1-R1_Chr10-1g02590 [Microbotryum saponariae]SDA06079.1 BZ3501_MvSof-1269-A2-R1_Chr10-1g02191 [Microbotryum saponariae]
MSRHNSSTLFDVDESATQPLAFQDFGSTTIASDVPSGRISPSGGSRSGSVGGGGSSAPSNLYEAEQRFEQTLTGATKSGGVLNLDFYTGYFDVDTVTVLTRGARTFLPREDYVGEVLSGVPDLYGAFIFATREQVVPVARPFWIPTTLIFSLFLISSLSASVEAYLAGEQYTYDFTRLGAAVSLVYMYCLGLPFIIWVALKYWAGSTERSAVEIVSLYGYQATIWIWLTLIPYSPLRAVLVLIATALSGAFLLRNLYPVIATAPNVSSRLLLIVIAILHLVLAIAMWVGFLAGGRGVLHTPQVPSIPGTGVGKTPTAGSDLPAPGGDGVGARLLF